MSLLPWIEDKHLHEVVSNLLARVRKAKDEAAARMVKNVVDPFSSLVLATITGMNDSDALIATQQMSSLSSAISNAVGDFHQEVPGHAPGFTNHDAGYDLECAGKKVIAEVKNKHNTMNAGKQARSDC